MQYILHVSSYKDIVPWATHFKGHVEGEHPRPCHGNSTHHRDGGVFCDDGHKLPEQVRWDVEADWSDARMERYLAACSKALRNDERTPDGPAQFDTEKDVIDRAVMQFLDGLDHVNDPAVDGDELWFGFVDPDGGPVDLDTIDDTDKAWGMLIAKCQRG